MEVKNTELKPLSVSIVVPVFSGERYLRDLMDAITQTRQKMRLDALPFSIAEVIFVDDDAIDKSANVVDALAAENDFVVGLHLSRNFGQHPATIAGILHTSGDWVVTMDEDLQHPPEKIIELFSAVASDGADVVYGKPVGGAHNTMSRDWTSRSFKRALEIITNNKHISKINSFRLIRGDIARAASSICGQDTFFDVALGWFTTRITALPMILKDTRFIETNRSGYRFRSLASHARRLALTSQIKMLRYGAVFGAIMLMASFVAVLLLATLRIFYPDTINAAGWTSLMVTIWFVGGLALFLIGIVLEYVSVLVMRANGKPLFFTVDRAQDAAIREWEKQRTDAHT